MMKNAVIAVSFLALWACSSAPKRPAEVFSLRNQAETQLQLVNRAADQGDYERALVLMEESMRVAVKADDPALLARNLLARGNIYFRINRGDDAQADWDTALAEAEAAGLQELAGLCRIYMIRARLLGSGGISDGELEAVCSQLQSEIALLKKDRLSAALGYTVLGLAEKERRNWAGAEAALQKALALHDKDRYLEDAAYDCYLIASVRSVSGDYNGALEALDQAVVYDRRAENTYGLAADWRARGDVLKKAGRTDEAASAYRRAAEIFRSLELEKEAADCDARI
ncbi:MAG: tetratricopeptide repeat protein [Treponema sp.]|jgi:tetratricopeptide (TPR) repeat protein|nr:tetratricopeptide repeat protein [Treponema sp.]